MGKIVTGKFLASLFFHSTIAILGAAVYLVLGYFLNLPELLRVVLIILGVSYIVSGWDFDKAIFKRFGHQEK